MTADQLERTRSAAGTGARAPARTGIKSMLLHVQNEESLDSRLQTALSLARAFDAHLECLHVTPIQAYAAFDAFGGIFVMDDVITAIEAEETLLRDRLSAVLRKEGVSWDYARATGDIPGQIVARAALADLIITSRKPRHGDFQGSTVGLIGDLLHRSRTPLLIAGDDGRIADPSGTALIAWNGSIEAANAVRSAVGALQLASDVQVLRIDEKKDEAFPSTRLLEYLSRHAIHAELRVETAEPGRRDPDFTYACLMAHAEKLSAAYMVMGGYSHHRVSEYLFGGLTRSMLAGCPIPLIIAH